MINGCTKIAIVLCYKKLEQPNWNNKLNSFCVSCDTRTSDIYAKELNYEKGTAQKARVKKDLKSKVVVKNDCDDNKYFNNTSSGEFGTKS